MADLGRRRGRQADFGSAGGKNSLGHLTLDLDYNDDDHIGGDGDSLSPVFVGLEK